MAFMVPGSIHRRDWNLIATPKVAGAIDPFYSSAWVIWNMQDADGTSPPADSSSYAKTYSVAAPLLTVGSFAGPFTGGLSCSEIQAGGDSTARRASAQDNAWDFNTASESLTMEGWVYTPSVTALFKSYFFRIISGSNWIWPYLQYTGGIMRAGVDIFGSSPIPSMAAGVPSNSWQHYVCQITNNVIYLGVGGARINSAAIGAINFTNCTLQMMNTVVGGNNGSGCYLGPHRVTKANRYNLDTIFTYTIPDTFFPTTGP